MPKIVASAKESHRIRGMVSIVITTYRRPEYLRIALASAVGQSYADLEVLVCDNAPGPDVVEVIQSFGDSRIVYVPHEHDLGVLGNAKDGLARARGEFFVKLDDDDVLFPGFVETLVEPMIRNPDITMSFSDFSVIDHAGRRMRNTERRMRYRSGRHRLKRGVRRDALDLGARGAISVNSGVFRADLLRWEEIPDEVGSSYDLYIALRACERGGSVFYEPRTLSAYRVHSEMDSLARSYSGLNAAVYILEDWMERNQSCRTTVIRKALARIYVRLCREYLAQGEVGMSRKMARASLRNSISGLTGLTAILFLLMPGRVMALLVQLHYRLLLRDLPIRVSTETECQAEEEPGPE